MLLNLIVHSQKEIKNNGGCLCLQKQLNMRAGSYSQVLLFFTVSQVFFRLVKHDMSFQYIPSPSDWSKNAITIHTHLKISSRNVATPSPTDPLIFPPVDLPVCATWCGFGHCDSDCSRQPSRCPCATARFCLFFWGEEAVRRAGC